MPAGLTPRRLLVASTALAAVFLLIEMREQVLLLDEWSILADYRGGSPSVLLNPVGESLELVPILIYKLLFTLFGPASIAPHLVTVALTLGCAVLLYLLAEERVDGWIALAAAVLVMLLGSATATAAASLGIPILLALACGLGMLLALEREDPAGDRVACGLISLGLASNIAALPFAVAGAVQVGLVSEQPWRRRAWVVAAPLAVYAVWRLWSLHLDPLGPLAAHPDEISLGTVAHLPVALARSLTAALLALTGLRFETGIPGHLSLNTASCVLAVVLVAGLVWLRWREKPALDPRVLAFAALPLTYWALIGIAFADRGAANSRYQFAGAVMLLLLAAELARGLKITREITIGVVAALLLATAVNAYDLNRESRLLRYNARLDRAELTTVELERDYIHDTRLVEPLGGYMDFLHPGRTVAGTPVPTTDAVIAAIRYLPAASSFGSAAYSLDDLGRQPGYVRAAADAEAASMLGLLLVPGFAKPLSRTPPVVISGAVAARRGGCVVTPDAPGTLELRLGREGIFLINGTDAAATVALGRFADGYPVPLTPLAPHAKTTLTPPPDAAAPPWRAEIAYGGRIAACSG